ncbi:MAG: lipopolysaccharide biosynthesis protein [Aureliella sp.]
MPFSVRAMSTTFAESSGTRSKAAGDYFLTGVLVMLCVNVVQRVVGLVRNFGFCRFLSEEQLGSWALANSFFVIIVPVALLGLTGGFGRFIEHYRRKGQLGDYLLSMLAVSSLGVVATCLAIGLASGPFEWLVFSGSQPASVVPWCIVTLLCLIVFSVVYEVVGGLRQVRVMSAMQFLQSTLFAVVGLPLIAKFGSWTVLLPSYSVACCVACLPGAWVLLKSFRQELAPSGHLVQSQMWKRILPYAGALWLLNLFGNLFEVTDRYMLLHMSGAAEIGQAVVGEYHCGRIIPNLLVSVALMLSGVLLPFVSQDWEAGNKDGVTTRLRQMLVSISAVFTVLGIAALTVAPYFFHVAFGDRYSLALGVLPVALAHATWVGLFLVIQNYLLCIEKTRVLLVLSGMGLVVNIGLNALLITSFGLMGAVVATSLSSLLALLLLGQLVRRLGCDLGASSFLVMLLPICLVGGPVLASAVVLAIVFVVGHTNWILSEKDRSDIDEAILPKLQKFGLRLDSIWP